MNPTDVKKARVITTTAKRPNLVRRIVREMTGKVDSIRQSGFWFGVQKIMNRANAVSVNYERNNYDLFRSIYWNSVVNKKGNEYLVAAALGKPIINITAGFVVGRGVTVELENPNQDAVLENIEKDINAWLRKNQGVLYNMAKYTYRDGDAYVHMDEFGNLTELDAAGVEVILDPISSVVIGCYVKNIVYINDVNPQTGLPSGSQTTWIYVKQYRSDSIRIFRYIDGQPEKAETLWERVFTADGALEISEASIYDEEGNDLGIPAGFVQERKLAVKMLHNEPEAQAVYGNSDYQNILAIFKEYSDVIKEAKAAVIYNAGPLPVLKGVVNQKQLAEASADPAVAGETEAAEQGSFVWGQDKILYLNGDKADAKLLQGQGVMDDAAKLLEIYFYLFVQGSETPEFVFGTAVSSSKASTETQIPIFVKKIERKQEEFSAFVRDLVETYVERRQLISDPLYLSLLETGLPDVSVAYPAIDDEDKTLTLETVQWAFENKMLSGETALELILGGKIKNISNEIKKAAAEAKQAAKEQAPEQRDRIVNDLLNRAQNTPAPAPAPATPVEA